MKIPKQFLIKVHQPQTFKTLSLEVCVKKPLRYNFYSSDNNYILFIVDGGYSSWGEFSECSLSCGGGSQIRKRACDNPKPYYGGKDCTHLGPANETRSCNTFYCPSKK